MSKNNNELTQFLTSINKTKKNVIRDSESFEMAERAYNSFIVNRLLSYHPDCVLYCNEINTLGAQISNLMHYEFLLNIVDKGNRFAKMQKPVKNSNIESVARYYGCSQREATEFVDLIDEDTLEYITDLYNSPKSMGGII